MTVLITDVTARDGLQSEAPVSVEDRAKLVDQLVGCGVRRIEVGAFVSPKAVPSMAGAADVVAAVTRKEGVAYVALVPNLKGAQLAWDAGVDEITITVSLSEAYSERNVGCSVAEGLDRLGAICKFADGKGAAEAVVSCALGSPYEGYIAPDEVAIFGRKLFDLGIERVTYADTTGLGTPALVRALVEETGPDIGLHLHDSRGTALVNAYEGYRAGVRRFDTATGGIGGSPFAAGAGGNLATESLVHLLHEEGEETGISLTELLVVVGDLQLLLNRELNSPLVRSGPRSQLATESG